MKNFKEKNISILGCGRSGLAVAKLYQKKGASVFVSDNNKIDPNRKEILKKLNIQYEECKHSEKILNSEIIIISPGIPKNVNIVKKAYIKKITIIGEIEAAWYFLKGKIATITGTNGKSTTTAILGHILSNASKGGFVGGNIAPGKPLSELVLNVKKDEWVCAEISSFQTEFLNDFKADGVIWTNISKDHLDRHSDFNEYFLKKSELIKRVKKDSIVISNRDDKRIYDFLNKTGVKYNLFSSKMIEDAYYLNGKIYFNLKKEDSFNIDVSKLNILGIHNYENIMAAGLFALKLGIDKKIIIDSVLKFKGLPHRLEVVGIFNNIRFINNSMCTNEVAFKRSLEAYPGSIVIVGGHEKNTDIDNIVSSLNKYSKNIILIGSSKEKIRACLSKYNLNYCLAESLEDALENAISKAKKGDTIILNPGMASFDMFDDFQDRGNKFKQSVKNFYGKQ